MCGDARRVPCSPFVRVNRKLPSVALPRLATGVGGLKWEEVKPLIQKHLADAGIPVIVYSEFHAGVAADEKL